MIINAKWIADNGPVNLFDAHGKQIHYFAWADTQTGEVVLLRTRKDGTFKLDPTSHTVRRRTRLYAGPLKIKFVFEGKSHGKKQRRKFGHKYKRPGKAGRH